MAHVKHRRFHFCSAGFYCFSNKGYDKTSIDDIIKISGGSKLSLYQYYGSKEKLYLHIYDSIFHRYRYSIQNAESSRDGMRDLFCCLFLLALISGSNGAPKASSRRLALYNEILTFQRVIGYNLDNIGQTEKKYDEKIAIQTPISAIIMKSILCGYESCEEMFKEIGGCTIMEFVDKINFDMTKK